MTCLWVSKKDSNGKTYLDPLPVSIVSAEFSHEIIELKTQQGRFKQDKKHAPDGKFNPYHWERMLDS